MAVRLTCAAIFAVATLASVAHATSLMHPTTQQGRCRQDHSYGGFCGCAPVVSAAACFFKALDWHELSAAQYRHSDQTCFLMHPWQNAPIAASCPPGCTAMAGNATVDFYTGDGDDGSVCLTSWETAPALDVQQGSCIVEGKRGGGCTCSGATSASSCFNRALHWFPLAAADWQTSSQTCNLLHLRQSQPEDCPMGCEPFEGNDNAVQFYMGDGDFDSVCLSSWWSPRWTVQRGKCQQDSEWGGHCDCSAIANYSMTHCFELAQDWDAVAGSEYVTNTRCLLMHQNQAAPEVCPPGCSAVEGSGPVDFYVGDGKVDGFCMTIRRSGSLSFGAQQDFLAVGAQQDVLV